MLHLFLLVSNTNSAVPVEASPIRRKRRVEEFCSSSSTNGVSVATDMVGVGLRVAVGGRGVMVGGRVGLGVEVGGIGGVTCKRIWSPGWMIEDQFSPFHPSRSLRLTSYNLAIHTSVSPL